MATNPNQYLGKCVIATYSFIQSHGLLIQKGSIGTVINAALYQRDEFIESTIVEFDIEFITEGNKVIFSCQGNNLDDFMTFERIKEYI